MSGTAEKSDLTATSFSGRFLDPYLRLLRYLRPYLWPYFVGGLVSMLLYSATEASIPFLVKTVFDDVFTHRDPAALKFVVVAVVVVSCLRGALNFGGSVLSAYVGQRVVTDVRNDINGHLQGLSLSFFNRMRAGQLVSRVINDVGLIRSAVTDAVALGFRDFATLIVLAGLAVYRDRELALLALVLIPVSAIPIWLLSRLLRRLSRERQAKVGHLTALLQETVQGNRVVKAFGMEGYERSRFAHDGDRLLRLHMRTVVLQEIPITELVAGI